MGESPDDARVAIRDVLIGVEQIWKHDGTHQSGTIVFTADGQFRFRDIRTGWECFGSWKHDAPPSVDVLIIVATFARTFTLVGHETAHLIK